jgi:hypothetical protein
VTQRIEPVGPRREIAPAQRVPLLGPVERELERERREQRRRQRSRKSEEPRHGAEPGGSLDVRA